MSNTVVMSTVGIVETEPSILPSWPESNFTFANEITRETPWLLVFIASVTAFVLSFLKR